jgi:hypothetical protein
MIILSCGHEVLAFEHAYDIMVKSNSREGEKAIGFMIVCGPCEDRYRKEGQIFDTMHEADEWLNKEQW